jgi:hypothetical protein
MSERKKKLDSLQNVCIMEYWRRKKYKNKGRKKEKTDIHTVHLFIYGLFNDTVSS